MFSAILIAPFWADFQSTHSQLTTNYYQLAAAVTVVFATGLLDDVLLLRAVHKFAGQILAALLAWSGGLQVQLFHGGLCGEAINLVLTVLWLVGCSNALKLIDGLDGLAGGVGLLASLTMLVAGLIDGNMTLAMASASIAGSLLAFLRYNFNPASVFLGDCGSLTIGFALGCLGLVWSRNGNTAIGATATLMALSLPLLDTALSLVRRLLRRRPLFLPDRGHIHHSYWIKARRQGV
jgi:UDP-GlcNAc:undecaprenyl-phosphate GlcNAc-1-phosphate transferase